MAMEKINLIIEFKSGRIDRIKNVTDTGYNEDMNCIYYIRDGYKYYYAREEILSYGYDFYG